MIYKKGVSFPYPVYYKETGSYVNCTFELEVTNVIENENEYIFTYKINLKSMFIKNLIDSGKAIMNIILQSSDSCFIPIKYEESTITVPKSRLSMNKRTVFQIQIQSVETITFESCQELTNFYDQLKENIEVEPNCLIGFSNTVSYDGEGNRPLQLFVYETNHELDIDFKVEIRSDVIALIFKSDEYLLKYIQRNLINMYVYVGLSHALTEFIMEFSQGEEVVYLDSIQLDNEDVLFQKLLDLMESKQINEISIENIDEIIHKMTNNLIKKYVEAIKEISDVEY